MPPLSLTPDQVLAFRLARHHLTVPVTGPDAAVRVAGTLLGAQAQVASAAVLQLRARSAALPEGRVAAALYEERRLVRLWAQRSTLHLLPSADLGLMLGVRRLMVPGYHRWYAAGGLEPAQVERLLAAVAGALEAGPMSRMDLSRRLTPELGAWAAPWLEHSWGGVLKLGAALGLLCHGPESGGRGGAEALFVGLRAWLGAEVAIPAARAAMAQMLRRYLAVYGPAAPADFRKFTGVPTGACRQAFADLAGEVMAVAVDGRALWALATDEGDLRAAEHAPGHVAVLGMFDPWVLAHGEAGLTVDPAHRPAVYRTAGWISAVVLRQGRVVATWRHEKGAAAKVGAKAGAKAGSDAPAPAWRVALTPLTRLARGEKAAIHAGLAHLADGAEIRLD